MLHDPLPLLLLWLLARIDLCPLTLFLLPTSHPQHLDLCYVRRVAGLVFKLMFVK